MTVMQVQQATKLAKFLKSKGLNGGRVGRLVLGAPFQDGDGRLLWDAALAASGRAAEAATGVEDLYEILADLSRPFETGVWPSNEVANLPE